MPRDAVDAWSGRWIMCELEGGAVIDLFFWCAVMELLFVMVGGSEIILHKERVQR